MKPCVCVNKFYIVDIILGTLEDTTFGLGYNSKRGAERCLQAVSLEHPVVRSAIFLIANKVATKEN